MLNSEKLKSAIRTVSLTLQQKQTEEAQFEACMDGVKQFEPVAADYINHVLSELSEGGLEGPVLDATVRSLIITTYTLALAYKLSAGQDTQLTSTVQLETGIIAPSGIDLRYEHG